MRIDPARGRRKSARCGAAAQRNPWLFLGGMQSFGGQLHNPSYSIRYRNRHRYRDQKKPMPISGAAPSVLNFYILPNPDLTVGLIHCRPFRPQRNKAAKPEGLAVNRPGRKAGITAHPANERRRCGTVPISFPTSKSWINAFCMRIPVPDVSWHRRFCAYP